MADLKFAAVRSDRKAFLTRAAKHRGFTAAYDALTLDCALACQGLAARLRRVDQVGRDMRMAGMHAEREEIFSLARQSKISRVKGGRSPAKRTLDAAERRYAEPWL